MTDIASLGIRVQTQGVAEADKQLDSLARTSEKTASSVNSAATTINKGFKPDTTGIKAQREELARLVGQIDPAVAALDRLDQQEKKLRQFRSKGLIDSGSFADLTAKINANRDALSRFTSHATSAGLSAKQLSQATRQLPMQFTDIFTSLATGQRPMQVLLQQGGQLKDVFGGIGPALRASAGYVAGLINPLTLAAAAIIGIGAAWNKASEESAAFNKALILTGNQAGLTSDQLRDMAGELDDVAGATTGSASAALAQVAQTGKFTAEQIGLVSKAALQMQDATGRAVEDTVKEFASLSGDPVDAIIRLNDAMGDGTNVTKFLTEQTLKQILALKEQGDEAGAAKVAIEAYASAINDRAPQVTQNLGLFASIWREIKNEARDAADIVMDAFREIDREGAELLKNPVVNRLLLGASVALPGAGFLRGVAVDANKPTFEGVSSSVSGVGGEIARAKALGNGEAKKFLRDNEEAQQQWNQAIRKGENDAARLKRELDEAEAAGKRLGKTGAEIASAQDAIRDSFAKKGGGGSKGSRAPRENTRGIENASDRFDDMVGSLRVELSGPMERVEQQHIKRMRELEQAARDGKRSHEDLTKALQLEGEAYRNAANDVQFRIDAEVAGLSGPIAQAQQAHEATLRRIEELKQQGLVTGQQYAEMLRQEASAYQADMEAAQRAADPIGALLSDMQAELDLIGKSNAERDIMVALRHANVDAMSAEGQAAIQTAKAFEDEAKAKQRSIELMDEFRSGASNALADIVTGAKSAKEAFADFFDDLARRITQMIAERWIEKAFGAMGTSNTGSSGGGIAAIFAALFGGGRAMGGSVQANRLYEVGEHNKPELLQMHGRSYLIPGNKGNVEPITNARGRGDINVTQNINVLGQVDQRTRYQLRTDAARNQRQAVARG